MAQLVQVLDFGRTLEIKAHGPVLGQDRDREMCGMTVHLVSERGSVVERTMVFVPLIEREVIAECREWKNGRCHIRRCTTKCEALKMMSRRDRKTACKTSVVSDKEESLGHCLEARSHINARAFANKERLQTLDRVPRSAYRGALPPCCAML